MKKALRYLLVTLVFSACYPSQNPPKEMIQPAEMQNLLWDVFSAQALASEQAMHDSFINQAAQSTVLSQQVFKLHHTDSAHFSKSYNWYVKHPTLLKKIFDSLYAQKQRESIPKLKINHKGPPEVE